MEHSGCVCMLRDDKVDDLKRMYNLFGRVSNGHTIMRDIISAYVRETGKALIMDEEKQKEHLTLVQSLLDLKDKYDRLLEAAFHNDKLFTQALNQVSCCCCYHYPKSSINIVNLAAISFLVSLYLPFYSLLFPFYLIPGL